MSKHSLFVVMALLGLCVACAGDAVPPNLPATQPAPGLPAAAMKWDTPPSPAPTQTPVSASHAFTNLYFAQDYQPGTKDERGQWMSGTETMRLQQYQGKLFATTEIWTDKPYFQPKGEQPWTGSQILVKESAHAPWRVEKTFPRVIRLAAMAAPTFVTDGTGRGIDPPATLLIASPAAPTNVATWTRDDADGNWVASPAPGAASGGFRSFCTHVDAVTKVQYLFGGGTTGSILIAVYDAAAPGHIRWLETPELTGTGRVMCMTEADGVLYAACGIKTEEPLSGGLFRRVDGDKPRWELLWRWPHKITARGDETVILRGLIAADDPNGGKRQVLLGTCDYPGVVYRIDPNQNYAVTTELDIHAYFAKVFGVPTLRGPCLSAYNNFLPATDPDTGEKVFLFGVWVNSPGGRNSDLGSSAYYLIRHADGRYSHGQVFDPNHTRPNPPRGLVATRTIELSSFPEDKGRVLYFGGYDPASIDSHDTAWIYKGTLPAVASKPAP